jgi:hypothetical protein
MGPKISVCRKKDEVYLKLMGNVSPGTALELLSILENLLMASLRFSSPDSPVGFTFRTHTKVDLARKTQAPAVLPSQGTSSRPPFKCSSF